MRLQQHQTFRPTDVTFVEELPVAWTAKPLKVVGELLLSNVDKHSIEGQPRVRLCNYTDVYYNERITDALSFMEATASPAQISRLTLTDGDVVLTKDSEDRFDIGVPAVVVGEIPRLVCGYHLAVVKPKNIEGRFLRYFLQSQPAKSYFSTHANGLTRYGLGKDDLTNIRVPFPVRKEQRTIAAFLDFETAKIDRLIAKQERLIALLKEKRQAVISHAVTKGLNPDAPMKDSGVEWLGEVPEHWDIVQVRRVGRVDQGSAFAHSIQGRDSGDIPWFKVADTNLQFNEVYLTNSTNRVSVATAQKAGAEVFPEHTLVFPRVGAALLTNKRRMLGCPGVIDDNLFAIIPESVEPFYLYLIMTLVDLGSLCSAGLVPTVTFETIKAIHIPVPPVEEQKRISQEVRDSLVKFDDLIELCKSSLSLLVERRSALISAAVTGKIDLRDWKPPTNYEAA